MVLLKMSILTELIEKFAKIRNMVSGENVEILHIKVSQNKFQGMPWIDSKLLI